MVPIRIALVDHLSGMPAPVLFVGAGLSRRYAKTESWEGLLRRFADLAGHGYDYYRTSANGDMPTIATRIAEDFHDIWWSKKKFQKSRDHWGSRIAGRESPLKVEVAAHLAGCLANLPKAGGLAEEIESLKRAVVDGIITTNFDPVLEHIFPDFHAFVGQDGLLFSNPQGIAEIYQIHGSCANPDTIVLTADDYRRFEDRNAYLAAKLLTIFSEHPVIFIGYALRDRNVVSIVRSVARCLTEENISQLHDRLIFVQWDPSKEPSIVASTLVADEAVIPVRRVTVPDFSEVFAALGELKRSFPAKLLRRLKEQVYELVLDGDPAGRLHVADIDDNTRPDEIDIVFGVGIRAALAEQGYIGLDRFDLIDDLTSNSNLYESRAIVQNVLPKLLRSNGYVPIFKYLRGIDAIDHIGRLKPAADVSPKIASSVSRAKSGFHASQQHKRRAQSLLEDVEGIADLQRRHGKKSVLDYAACLSIEKVDPEYLRKFLVENRALRDESQWYRTQYCKLACFYDWLAYGVGQNLSG